MQQTRLLIVGAAGGSNIGESLLRAAHDLNIPAHLCDSNAAWRIGTIQQSVFWHFAGQRPIRLARFNAQVRAACREFAPTVLVATGRAGANRSLLRFCRRGGIRTVNFLTDDPFNRKMPSPWFRKTLTLYDTLYSPRRSNIEQLREMGCHDVRYLQFAYDPHLFYPDVASDAQNCDLFFVGHFEQSRFEYIRAALANRFRVRLYGNGWRKSRETKHVALGKADIPTMRREAAAAKVSLCCVRHDNRDGHSMRTFELPALRACMIVEDTLDHRQIFGEDGSAVHYFATPEEMVRKTHFLLANRDERERLRAQVHALITNGNNTYADRLQAMMAN